MIRSYSEFDKPKDKARSRLAVVGVILAFIISGGCGPSASSLVGDWVGERELIAPEGASPEVVASARRVKLNIPGDGSFTMVVSGIPLEGVVLSGTQLKLTRVFSAPVENGSARGMKVSETIHLKSIGPSQITATDPLDSTLPEITLRRK